MGFRIIALDLDGTTLDSHGAIRPSTKAAVSAALARGLEVVLVTGRHHVATRPYHVELGLTSETICCNGTYVYDFAASKVIVGNAMSREQARRMLAICRRHNVHCFLYLTDAMTFEVPNARVERLCAWANSFPPDTRPDIRQVDSFDREIDRASGFWKFVVSHDDADVLAAWQAEANESGEFSLEFSWTNLVDAVLAGNTKGQRLLDWAAARGVAADEIIAFGDNHNDLSMIGSVGLGVAMGNAEEALKAAAGWVTGDNDSDGIAETIERFAL
ncbi:pyridoxal phosphatase [Telmatospirillum sp.]|uniref:pyridoxal phosphatase n=1 Tax=Telmatospirillum sp. TaxID=2079197 RepID=UPI00284A9B19|nr:pyridoxal phosphatase [Telmatospirillum sp.]MDR3440032.1 pyridoxal phosphatase [Telmatospirillum sp.]